MEAIAGLIALAAQAHFLATLQAAKTQNADF
jgi:hypothetical protein